MSIDSEPDRPHSLGSPETAEVASAEAVEAFIERWTGAGGTERANYQLFLTELCALLGLPQPDPARDDTRENAYVFERRVTIRNPDGTENRGYIDLYRRGCFVLEAKQTGKSLDTGGWDKAMLAAQNQADQYARALPIEEGRPPFIVVTDVGRNLELYSEFSRSGGTYVPFPDPSSHRIRLDDLREPQIQRRLYLLWTAPDELDLTKKSARVTREVSTSLARLAQSLERDGYDIERVAHFLKRCLFTMFSEDVELLPKDSFTQLLERLENNPQHFPDAMRTLWETMNTGGYEGQLMEKIQRFNGGLFHDIEPIALDSQQIRLLIQAAKADWSHVEPAIFGTLLERALDPRERHKLGAHYTPRAYVERLVIPTVIDPLRSEWDTVKVAAEAWLQKGKEKKALEEVKSFHHRLCGTRVLDPACGSGNFLYVALEHFKRLEGEVINVIRDLTRGQESFDTEGLTVDPHQFLGLEINPRAAAIAEIVLWIGYLQWHYRLNGRFDLPEPILRDFHNIQHLDALLECDSRQPELDERGEPVTIWDGISFKESNITGDLVPDENERITVYRYINPRPVEWPETDYIVGNPPFIGEKRMRDSLGDGYTEAVRAVYSELPACDFVMYWWHKAAQLVAEERVKRFGFITTNSVVQSRNRAVVETHLSKGSALLFAVPDHPWVDSADGAAVRIAMTVVSKGDSSGRLLLIRSERDSGEEAKALEFYERRGTIFADLTVGAPLLDARPLASNDGLVFQGVKLVGNGFLVTPEQRTEWISDNPEYERFLPELVAGSDLTKRREPRYCIDFFGLDRHQARSAFPGGFQKLVTEVKPHRDTNKDRFFRENWWLFGRTRGEMRSALKGLSRYIATSEVSKHRFFVRLDSGGTLADGSLAVVALDDPFFFGVLSSRVHVRWALAQGGKLESRPRWQNGPCFLNFPFPEASSEQIASIQELAVKLDTHRRARQQKYGDLTLTDMYNVLEKLHAGESLTTKERAIHEKGVVSVLKELHDELDRSVFDAYGWDDLGEVLVGCPGATTPLSDKPGPQIDAEQALLSRLVDLNIERAAEESQGHVRWLRSDYQAPDSVQISVGVGASSEAPAEAVVASTKKPAWPKTMSQQVEAVRGLLSVGPQTLDTLAGHFKRKPAKSINQVLAALEVLGQAEQDHDRWRLVGPGQLH